MRILYILHGTIMDGATISFLNMVRGIKGSGGDIYVIIPHDDIEIRKELNDIASGVFVAPIIGSVYPKWTGDFVTKIKYCSRFLFEIKNILIRKYKSYKELTKIVKRIKPDIIHTNVGVVHEGFWCAKRMGIPHVWHLREYQDKDFNWLILPSIFIFKHLLKHSNVIAITKDILLTFGLKESEMHRTIYNGILPLKSCAFIFPKDNYFLCASRVSPEKGHEDVIKCFSEFYRSNKNYKLLILGFGTKRYIDHLRKLTVEYGCECAVEFVGFKKDVLDYMRKAKALIVASRYEGFGRMTAEACFSNCLVIGHNTGGTKEILAETGGLSFLTNDELLQNMQIVDQMNDADYKRIVNYACQKASSLYSIDSNVSLVLDFYNDIIIKHAS